MKIVHKESVMSVLFISGRRNITQVTRLGRDMTLFGSRRPMRAPR